MSPYVIEVVTTAIYISRLGWTYSDSKVLSNNVKTDLLPEDIILDEWNRQGMYSLGSNLLKL